MQTAVTPNLLKQQLAAGKPARLHVISNSMAPLILAGNQIELVHHEIAALKVGDIITVLHQNELLTHRLIKVDAQTQTLILRGQWQRHIEEQVRFSSHIGKVRKIYRANFIISLDSWGWTAVNYLLLQIARGYIASMNLLRKCFL